MKHAAVPTFSRRPRTRSTACAALLVLLAGCASHERRCEGKLEPINPAPAPVPHVADHDHDR
jgi:hypothetical protein